MYALLVDRMHKAEIPITAIPESNKASLSHPQVTKGMAVLQCRGTRLPPTEVLKQLSLFDTNNTATYTCHPYPFALGKALIGNYVNEVIDCVKACCRNGHIGNPGLRIVTSHVPFYSSLTAPQPLRDSTLVWVLLQVPSLLRHAALWPVLAPLPLLILFSLLLLSPCISMIFKNRQFLFFFFFYSNAICPSGSEEMESTMHVPKPPPSH